MWKLVIEDDEGKRTVVPLMRERYSIGRKDGRVLSIGYFYPFAPDGILWAGIK